jgi:mono/diheme cytochrome c family protein
MMPPPPYLIDSGELWSPAELYWIVRNGVTMTAMPAWDRRLSARETWQVVAFLEALPHTTYADYLRRREATRAARAL